MRWLPSLLDNWVMNISWVFVDRMLCFMGLHVHCCPVDSNPGVHPGCSSFFSCRIFKLSAWDSIDHRIRNSLLLRLLIQLSLLPLFFFARILKNEGKFYSESVYLTKNTFTWYFVCWHWKLSLKFLWTSFVHLGWVGFFFFFLAFSFHFFPQDVGLCIFRRIVLYFDSRCPDALDRKGVSVGNINCSAKWWNVNKCHIARSGSITFRPKDCFLGSFFIIEVEAEVCILWVRIIAFDSSRSS